MGHLTAETPKTGRGTHQVSWRIMRTDLKDALKQITLMTTAIQSFVGQEVRTGIMKAQYQASGVTAIKFA
ncbi:hypothetical protein [Ferrovibrio sp.]|uniref:hypothetical protein n=1 Tax=Ferrovibrio sp. TaxID=1917215 RepID=UPI00262EBBBD|nr:hypothetical protein [Ferrovibrio sp.]